MLTFRLVAFVGASLASLALIYAVARMPKNAANQFGFPFEIVSERRIEGVRLEQQASILIDKTYYSKENLSLLFNWYSGKFPDKEVTLNVQVATDRSFIEPKFMTGMADPVAGTNTSYKDNHVVTFKREAHHIAGVVRLNAWYRYSPNLSDSNVTMTVVLKGKDPHAIELPIEEKNVVVDSLRLKLSSYRLKGTEPDGTYYTFHFGLGKTASQGFDELFTVRHEKNQPISQDQIRFINNQIVYVRVGWVFAVTVNGGSTWKIWNAEEYFPNWTCCDLGLIESVEISAEGTGTMTLQLSPQSPEGLLVLRTADYGQHWAR